VRDLLPHCQSDSLAAFTILHLDLPGSPSVVDCVRALAVVSAAVGVGMGFDCPDPAFDSQRQVAHFHRATAMLAFMRVQDL
jgi:hypothetical protein